jgi:A/G-specific adenine glycosylase
MKRFHKIFPVEKVPRFQKRLEGWYGKNKRQLPWRETSDPYRIWVSEVMLQQTQVTTVLKYYSDFIQQFPDVTALAAADLQQVLKSWELLGYYARARNLHQAVRIVAEKFQGYIPTEYSQFHQLPGVGEYIAAAVTSLAYNEPYPVLDGNVKRVLSRLFCLKEPINRSASHKKFRQAAAYIFNAANPSQFNQAIMELGALICKPRNPKCSACPVKSFCRAFIFGLQQEFPKKINRAPIPQHHIAIAVIQKNERLLITQRSYSGLLAGLWEFPGGKIHKSETAREACIREIKEEVNLQVEIEEHLTRVKHAYSHFQVVLEVFLCRYLSGRVRLNGSIDHRWITFAEVEQYPFPAANHKIFPILRQIFQ